MRGEIVWCHLPAFEPPFGPSSIEGFLRGDDIFTLIAHDSPSIIGTTYTVPSLRGENTSLSPDFWQTS